MDKQYFYLKANSRKGPYSFEELKKEKLNPETLIWYDGLDEWLPMKDIPTFNSFFIDKI